MSKLIATVGYVGLLPYAPGTWGSAVAIPLAWLIHGLFWVSWLGRGDASRLRVGLVGNC